METPPSIEEGVVNLFLYIRRGVTFRKKLTNNYRFKITQKLNYHINDSKAYKDRHKHGPEGAFTRKRLLPFGHLIISILKMGRTGLQREMDTFFKETENEAFSIRKVTKGGFSKSRRNLAPEAFSELNDIIWKDFYQEVEYLGYKGHRLLAVDGTFLNLPNHESIREEFGIRDMGRGKKKDVPKSMCLLSMLYDPVNYMTLDVQPGPTDGSELQLLLKHLDKVAMAAKHQSAIVRMNGKRHAEAAPKIFLDAGRPGEPLRRMDDLREPVAASIEPRPDLAAGCNILGDGDDARRM